MASDFFMGQVTQLGGLRKGHFALKPTVHSDTYIDLDVLFPHAATWKHIGKALAGRFDHDAIDTIVGVRIGEPALSSLVSQSLVEVAGVNACFDLERASSNGSFFIRPEQLPLIVNKRVLVVTDILLTGNSAKSMVEAIRAAGGNVVGVGALCNRLDVTKAILGDVPKLSYLSALANAQHWRKTECSLCKDSVPLDEKSCQDIRPVQ